MAKLLAYTVTSDLDKEGIKNAVLENLRKAEKTSGDDAFSLTFDNNTKKLYMIFSEQMVSKNPNMDGHIVEIRPDMEEGDLRPLLDGVYADAHEFGDLLSAVSRLAESQVRSVSVDFGAFDTGVARDGGDCLIRIDDSKFTNAGIGVSAKTIEGHAYKPVGELTDKIRLNNAEVDGGDIILRGADSLAYVLDATGVQFELSEEDKEKRFALILAADGIFHVIGSPINRSSPNTYNMTVHNNWGNNRSGRTPTGIGEGGYSCYNPNGPEEKWAWCGFDDNRRNGGLEMCTYGVTDAEHTFETSYDKYRTVYKLDGVQKVASYQYGGDTLDLGRFQYALQPAYGFAGVDLPDAQAAELFPIRIRNVRFRVTGGSSAFTYDLADGVEKPIISTPHVALTATRTSLKLRNTTGEYVLADRDGFLGGIQALSDERTVGRLGGKTVYERAVEMADGGAAVDTAPWDIESVAGMEMAGYSAERGWVSACPECCPEIDLQKKLRIRTGLALTGLTVTVRYTKTGEAAI